MRQHNHDYSHTDDDYPGATVSLESRPRKLFVGNGYSRCFNRSSCSVSTGRRDVCSAILRGFHSNLARTGYDCDVRSAKLPNAHDRTASDPYHDRAAARLEYDHSPIHGELELRSICTVEFSVSLRTHVIKYHYYIFRVV